MEKEKTRKAGRWSGVKGVFVYLIGYTALFCVTAAGVFVWFYLNKRRFVWKTDGVNQHYYGLLYFSRWGKEVLRQFKETGVLKIPTFTLRMGYGEDLYTTLAYYVIGDPFIFPALFIPEKHLLLYHDLMLVVRFWLAGITFSAYCFYMKKGAGRLAVLTGTIVYIFNGFTMSGMRHHYFLNPFVFFPLLLIGCERYFRKRKPGLFILMIFVTAVSNFYFFYMMVLMTVLYALWRSVRMNGLRRFGRVILDGIAFVFYGLVGTLLSSFIFLPVVLRFLQDPRAADSKKIPLMWPVSFYKNFVDTFITNGNASMAESWTYMGFGAFALVCVLFVFVQRKRHFDLKAAFTGLTALILTPAAGYVLNGFSYSANRWMWAYALLIGYMTATAVQEMTRQEEAEENAGRMAVLLVLFALIIGICVCWDYTFSRSTAQSVIIAMFGLAAALLGLAANNRSGGTVADPSRRQGVSGGRALKGCLSDRCVCLQAALLLCTVVSVISAGYFDFARSGGVFEYLTEQQIEIQMQKDSAAAAKLIKGNLLKGDGKGSAPFYRYTTYNPENNTSLLYGVSNTQYYWSLSNPDTAQFFNETGQLNRMIHQYDSLDDRTSLNEIAGIRYFLGNDEDGVPFGYEKKEGLSYSNSDVWPENAQAERFSCEVYENTLALPLGFTSNRWISRQEYDAMDIPKRQQALMQGILLEADPGQGFVQASETSVESAADRGIVPLLFSDQRVPVQIETVGKIVSDENSASSENSAFSGLKYHVNEGGAVLKVCFSGLTDCETYLYVRGLNYEPPAGRTGSTRLLLTTRGFSGDKMVSSKQLRYTTQMDPWTTGRKDFLVNMCYRRDPLDRIEIVLPAEGTFSFDSIEVVCQPMSDFAAQAQALRKNVLRDLDIHEMGESLATEWITGRIDMNEPGILCLQIPRAPGWKAYVDGRREELLRADTMFSALLLDTGSHVIELRYQTPGLRLGAVVSAVTMILVLLFGFIYTLVSLILGRRERRAAVIPEGEYRQEEKNG